MYLHVEKYGLQNHVQHCIINNCSGEIDKWKQIVKKAIWQTEVVKWKVSCVFYRQLDIYKESVNRIELHAWWSLLKLRPHLGKSVSSLMAVLLGGQPSGLQCNFSKSGCRICNSVLTDDCKHILLHCPGMTETRERNIELIRYNMPPAMLISYDKMNEYEQLVFLLSGLNSRSTSEWPDLYEAIAQWLYEIYRRRKQKYMLLEEMIYVMDGLTD